MDLDLDQALRALRAGEPNARERFGQVLFAELQQFFSRCFKRAHANELTQITFLVVWEKLDSFEPRGPDSFRRWVHKIAANKAQVLTQSPARAAAREAKLAEHQAMQSPAHGPNSWLLRREQDELLDRHKHELPDHERRALDHALAGGDDRSLAEDEGIAVASARSRRHRAKLHVVAAMEAKRKTPESERSSTPA